MPPPAKPSGFGTAACTAAAVSIAVTICTVDASCAVISEAVCAVVAAVVAAVPPIAPAPDTSEETPLNSEEIALKPPVTVPMTPEKIFSPGTTCPSDETMPCNPDVVWPIAELVEPLMPTAPARPPASDAEAAVWATVPREVN